MNDLEAILLGGRAGGHHITANEPHIWVAMLNGTPRALPNHRHPATKDEDDLVARVRPGQWSLYEARGAGVYQWIRDQEWPVGELPNMTAALLDLSAVE